MSRSRVRGQVEPTAALVVLLAVCLAVATYATALPPADHDRDRDVAAPTLDRVVDVLSTGGVVDPSRTPRTTRVGPTGYRVNVTVAAAGRRWSAGPSPPFADVGSASRTVGVDRGGGRIAVGRVRVEVWS